MSESKRWLDEGAPSEVGSLLRAGRCERPNRASVQRALIAVGVTGAASTAAGSALGAGGKVAAQGLLGFVAKWTAIGALSAGAVVGAATGVQHYRASSDALQVVKPEGPKSKTAAAPAMVVTNEKPLLDVAPVNSPEITAAQSRVYRAVNSITNPSGAPAADQALAEEIRLIDQARASLRSGDANATLQRVSDYERRFPSGRFEPEALYLRMEGLQRLGNSQAASAVAQIIVDRFPQSPQVSRASEILRQVPSPQNP